jgi:hypothetical protein
MPAAQPYEGAVETQHRGRAVSWVTSRSEPLGFTAALPSFGPLPLAPGQGIDGLPTDPSSTVQLAREQEERTRTAVAAERAGPGQTLQE